VKTTKTPPVPRLAPAAWKKAEAAAYLNISEVTLLRLVRAGEVPHPREGTTPSCPPHGREEDGGGR